MSAPTAQRPGRPAPTQLEQLRGSAAAVRFPHVLELAEQRCHDGWRWQAWCGTCRLRSPWLPRITQAVDAVLGHPLLEAVADDAENSDPDGCSSCGCRSGSAA